MNLFLTKMILILLNNVLHLAGFHLKVKILLLKLKYNQYLILTNPSQNDTTIVLDGDIEENKDLDSFTVPLPSDYKYEIINVDTLLFDMSSILYFELDLNFLQNVSVGCFCWLHFLQKSLPASVG